MRNLTLVATACATLIAGLYLSTPATAASPPDQSRYYSKTYQPCLDTGENMRGCTSAELKRWDDQLNAIYRQLMATLPPERQTILRNGERTWIKKTSTDCAENPDKLGGEDLYMVEDGCTLDATIERVHYLQAFPH
jgi:uncharacterized protein YecT (DUF1311 family)